MSNTTFDLGANSQVPLTVIPTDAAGNLVTGAIPVVASSDETVVTIGTAADGTTLVTRVTKSSGTATVKATFTKSDGSSVEGTIVLTLSPVGAAGNPADAIANVELVPGIAS
jgi:hypothetical protein